MSEWTAKGFTIYEQETGLRVACVDYKGHLKETAERNTRLIAAAPEMYELLMEAADELGIHALWDRVASDCYELLARIDGEQEAQE